MKNIQDELIKIHDQYGISEVANYKIQLLCELFAEEYHNNKTPNKPKERGYFMYNVDICPNKKLPLCSNPCGDCNSCRVANQF